MLTPAQQSSLDYHLREINLLTNEELIQELTDHYTTGLIDLMAEGKSFEIALTEVQKAFGGIQGLQKLEREYNTVTFRHYDEHWRYALMVNFQKPLLWRRTIPTYMVLILLAIWIGLSDDTVRVGKWNSFWEGGLPGFIIGFLFTALSAFWPYIKSVYRHGWHNAPTEALYLFKRQGLFIFLFCTIALVGYFVLLPLVPFWVQALAITMYAMALGLFMQTSRHMHELLYEYEPSR